MASRVERRGSREERKTSREERRISKNPKHVMEQEAKKLILTITDIEQEEENFEICERFVLSNLFYHKFLDPDENKVRKSFEGLHQKFLIHAQPLKAQQLGKLVDTYTNGEVWEDHHAQFDVR